jgi:hypothetical protein
MTMIPHEGGADGEGSMWMLFAQYPFWEVQGTRPISLTGGPKPKPASEQKARETKGGGKKLEIKMKK